MKKFTADKNSEGMRLDRFMSKSVPGARTGDIYKALRKKKVRVNGKHFDGAYRLSIGDEICIYMNDEFFDAEAPAFQWVNSPCEIDVAYEDSNIVIAYKPAGLPSQEIEGVRDSLESRIRSYLFRKGEINMSERPLFVPSLCHRIDRNTAGLLIAAKNHTAQTIVNQMIKERKIRKLYLCRTERAPKPSAGEICGWLVRSDRDKKMIFYDEKPKNAAAQYCKTAYRTVNKAAPCIVEAELFTGRKHQIRVSFAHIGCPLCGDVKYGAGDTRGGKYQALEAYKIVFDFDDKGGPLDYLAHRTVERQSTALRDER